MHSSLALLCPVVEPCPNSSAERPRPEDDNHPPRESAAPWREGAFKIGKNTHSLAETYMHAHMHTLKLSLKPSLNL